MSSLPDVKPPLRIAFAGLKGHGKSTAAKRVQHWNSRDTKDYFRQYSLLSFAEPLKRAVDIIFDLDGDKIEDKEAIIPQWGVSYRTLLQRVGTDLFRDLLPKVLPELKLSPGGIWVTNMLHRIYKLDKLEVEVCIVNDDCRFEDEYQALKSRGFTIVRIERPSLMSPDAQKDTHASEKGCSYDRLIVNDGTKEEFLAKIDKLVEEMQQQQGQGI
jgi:hypothetical protein